MSDPIKSALGPTANCPPLEILARPERNSVIEGHVAGCAHCRTELSLLREFESAEPLPEERASVEWISARLRGESRNAPAAWRRESVWERLRDWFAPMTHRALAGAMAAVLIVGVGLYLRQEPRAPQPASVDGTVWRSGGLTVLAPSGDLPQAPTDFRWETVPGAAVYHVSLMEVDRTVIWSADSSQADVRIPDEVRAQFKPGRAFHWHVTATSTSGQTLASSDLQSFHIALTRP